MFGHHPQMEYPGSWTEGMLRIGRVSAVDQAKARIRVVFPDRAQLVSGWLPVLQPRTLGVQDYALPITNEHVCCLFRGNGIESGICLGSIFDNGNLPAVAGNVLYRRYDDGNYQIYHQDTHQYAMVFTGGLQITADVIITGDLTVSETVTAVDATITGDLTAADASVSGLLSVATIEGTSGEFSSLTVGGQPVLTSGGTRGAGQGGGSSSSPSFAVQSAVAVGAGQAVYLQTSGVLALARANAIATANVVGLAIAANAANNICTVQSEGPLTLTDWTAAIGSTNLTVAAVYYLDPANAGKLTTVAPTIGGQCVVPIGEALTTTTLLIGIRPRILL